MAGKPAKAAAGEAGIHSGSGYNIPFQTAAAAAAADTSFPGPAPTPTRVDMQEPAITTPAKINLYLEVLAKRADGYHDLETVFVPLPGLCDRLACEPLAEPGLQILCDDTRVPTGETNLVWKAALAFAAAARVAPQWRFRLDKFIPVAAGLGGGSSDAATAPAVRHAYG